MKLNILIVGLIFLGNHLYSDLDHPTAYEQSPMYALISRPTNRENLEPYPYQVQRVNLTDQIPVIEVQVNGFTKVPDVAQYGGADWSNVVGIAHHVTLQEAAEIARNNPEIDYFFYMKGFQMVLHSSDDTYGQRIFRQKDAVFFSGEPWWGSAAGFADGYVKE